VAVAVAVAVAATTNATNLTVKISALRMGMFQAVVNRAVTPAFAQIDVSHIANAITWISASKTTANRPTAENG
jgi:hypothetical protein